MIYFSPEEGNWRRHETEEGNLIPYEKDEETSVIGYYPAKFQKAMDLVALVCLLILTVRQRK